MTATTWLSILDETADACMAHGRPDLARRLSGHRAAPAGGIRLAFLGLAKQGKRQLVNALVNAPVCAVGDGEGTAVPTEIRHADIASAALVHQHRQPMTGEQRVPIAIEQIAAEVAGDPARTGTLMRAEVGVPRELLASGLVVIDTPAVGEPRSAATAVVLDVLAWAHAVVLVSDASQELLPAELALAKHIATWCPALVIALTKVDACPGWRGVAERDRMLLGDAGVGAQVLPVSAVVRQEAARRQDRELNARSGFPALLDWVAIEGGRTPEEADGRLAAMCVRAVAEDLVGSLKAELRSAGSSQAIDQVGVVQAAQRTVDELRRHTVRWQNLLSDEIADLVSDIEYDLRERTRKIVQIIDRTFDDADPGEVWDGFQQWLEQTLTEAVETNYGWLIERAEWIADSLADTFASARRQALSIDDIPVLDLGDAEGRMAAEDVDGIAEPRIEPFKLSQKLFTGLRGSYGGVLMFGLATGLAGLPLINPVSLSAGAAFATKSIRDEGDARLKRRQAVAKAAAQRYVDDVFLRFSKECRDIVRGVQRQLRDHFSALTDQLAEDAARAREAFQTGAAHRDQRNLEVKRQIERLAELHGRAGKLGARGLERAGRIKEISG